MKRLILIILTLALTISALAEGNLESIDSYDVALKWIKQAYGYKEPRNIEMALEGIEEVPTEAFYRQYKTYLTGIMLIHEAGYNRVEPADIKQIDIRKLSEARAHMNLLVTDEQFMLELESRELPLPSAVNTYISGLIYENRGNIQQALDAYTSVRKLFDAEERAMRLDFSKQDNTYMEGMRLFEDGEYWQAYLKFGELDEFYVPEGETYLSFEMAEEALRLHKQNHRWEPATCVAAKTCRECGETEGDPLGHDWQEATCTEPKTCKRCGATEGEPLGHEWKDATCTEPGVCTRCNAVGTDPTGHKWKEATCTEPKTCTICGAKEGEPLDHNWQPATYERPEMCSRCGLTRGEKLKPKIAVGDIVTYGTYPQTVSGTDNIPIEWIVLEIQNDKALLISKYALECKPYNTSRTDVTWETCTLRTWLNNDFIDKAFTAQERQSILTTNVDNSRSQGYSGYDTNGGNNTQDKVFLLSFAEANKYFSIRTVPFSSYSSSNIEESLLAPTEYVIKRYTQEVDFYTKTADGENTIDWWLRSPGKEPYKGFIAPVSIDLSVDDLQGIRPTMWVKIDSISLLNDTDVHRIEPSPFVTYEREVMGMITEDTARVYDNPCLVIADLLGYVDCNSSVKILASNGDFAQVKNYLGETGYIMLSDLQVISSVPNTTRYQYGDIVTFGRYPQTTGSTAETPIEWFVIDVQGNNALLLSRYVLDEQPYNTSKTEVTWETCTLRKWLNHDFFGNAFSRQEQQAIRTTYVDNSKSQFYNGWGSGSNKPNTQDKVFLLSYAEADKYIHLYLDSRSYVRWNDIRILCENIYDGKWYDYPWWLRSQGLYKYQAAEVCTGRTELYKSSVNNTGGVCPAIWVDLSYNFFGKAVSAK